MSDFGFMTSAVFGALIAGLIAGAIPLIAGAIKGKIGLGLGGFFACIACSFILGLLLALPCCALFMFLIFKKNPDEHKYDIPSNNNGVFCKNCGNKLSNNEDFCPYCGNRIR